MFEEFSAGYDVCRLSIERSDGKHAVMDREDHEAATKRIYSTGGRGERVARPVFAKVDDVVFPVFGASDVPPGTLLVPDYLLEATGITDPPTVKAVLVATETRALPLLEIFRSATVTAPDHI